MSKALLEAVKKQQAIENGTGINFVLENTLNKFFHTKAKGAEQERKGLHASALLASDNEFCYREQVLSLIYKRNQLEAKQFPDNVLRIFKEGDCVHEKWQNMFIENNVAIGIEKRTFSKKYSLYLTPDAIIKLGGTKYVVEIKSCNTYSYKSIKAKHPTGSKQIQIYMHFTGIPKGFVLCEDKNNQEFKCLYTEYDVNIVLPYLERLEKIKRYYDNKQIPKKAHDLNSNKCKQCALYDACTGNKRVKL